MTNQTENFYNVLSSVFSNFGGQNGGRQRRRQAVVTRSQSEASAFNDCVTWSAGLLQAIADDLQAVWTI